MSQKIKDVSPKPIVGLALGSGSAKGWAHIGVLRGLANLGVQPDKVAGCSIGAVVGAAYANDMHLELEKWVLGFSSWDVLGLMDLSWRRGGLIDGERVFDALQTRIGSIQIEDLKRPFAAVATDLYTGQEIWFRKGELRHAVRASCSMPGFLQPIKQGGRWLVDGAVVNPIPVSVIRALETDVVIAVDVNGQSRRRMPTLPLEMSGTRTKEEDAQHLEAHQDSEFMDLLARGKEYISGFTDKFANDERAAPGMLAVMSQSMEILEQRHKRARLMGDPPNVCIVPDVSDIGTMEFHRGKEAIYAGEKAVDQVAHLIEAAI